jgi:opacity protein-like surface antigen
MMGAMALGFGSASAVQAADLLPPAPELNFGGEVSELGAGWYLRGDIGYVDYQRPKDVGFYLPGVLPLDGERLESAWSVGGGIGYQISSWLRTDATIDYRFGSEFSGTRPFPTYDLGYVRDRADLESTTLLLNGYVDLGSWSGVTPYVGAGIGVAGNRLTNYTREAYALGAPTGTEFLEPHTTYNLAWALMAGVGIDLGSGMALDFGYRFTHLGEARTRIYGPGPGEKTDELRSHEFRFGARYLID